MKTLRHTRTHPLIECLFIISLMGLLVACGGQTSQPLAQSVPNPAPTPRDVPAIGAGPTTVTPRDVPPIGAGPATVAPPKPTAAAAVAPLKLLKVDPAKGYLGDSFTITGDGYPAGKTVEFMWMTVEGAYLTAAGPENIEFHEKTFTDKRISLGKAIADAQGKVSVNLKTPNDYGEVHDIISVVDGQDFAKGGYRMMRNVTISPTAGPVGTPITIKVTGLGWKAYESTLLIRYDNNQVGMVTAITTKGSATFTLRAAGKAGKHVIDVNLGARAMAFLNNQQSGTAHIVDQRFEFTVTDDKTMPAVQVEWPEQARVVLNSDAVPRTLSTGAAKASSVVAALEPSSGPILSKPTLRVKGLTPNTPVEAFWVTARGNRVNPSGWSLYENSLAEMKANSDGTLSTPIEIPDDLGGWHVVKVVQDDKVVSEVSYFVERSLADVTPKRVKAGEIFTVHLKGIGWTELDNGAAITYDNSYIGFACGFNSNGDLTVNLTATGGPGIHLIDLYPMIYQGHGKPPWSYQVPFLTFAQDFPGLDLGYKLPAFRLAIEVVD